MGIWFGAVESLSVFGANICGHILGVVIPTNKSLYLHCILTHPDIFVGGLMVIQQGQPENHRINKMLIFQLPDRKYFSLRYFLYGKGEYMKKIFAGAILTFTVTSAATASIISRGFFDEAIQKYALKTDVGDISALETKIGTLPTGNIQWLCEYENHGLGGGECVPTNISLPTDIGGLISLLYSNEDGAPSVTNLLDIILNGFNNGGDEFMGIESLTRGYQGLVMDIYNISLPTDIDDGQYVLTAKKIDGDITYTWVKMDLTNEEQNK